MSDNLRSEKAFTAMNLFKQGYNCSQAVVGAFCDELGLDFSTCMKLASSFGGGMGRLREVCGAVSGMFMIAGLKYGYSEPSDRKEISDHYKRIQDLAKEFMCSNGSIVCRELLGLEPCSNKNLNPVPSERTDEYYKKRPCVELVGQAAEIINDLINTNC